ncbi:hypothetical protein CDAR_566011 [Caerostris darwini]|uniref:Uncharacterized protein n=1 Tax=Caerostris darwini TaxID=1538125 RepID=A0AAV4QCG0_9ARAC|nr:hypothetical protein CDAR_566011 [Caerostris darwini]
MVLGFKTFSWFEIIGRRYVGNKKLPSTEFPTNNTKSTQMGDHLILIPSNHRPPFQQTTDKCDFSPAELHALRLTLDGWVNSNTRATRSLLIRPPLAFDTPECGVHVPDAGGWGPTPELVDKCDG